MSDLAIIAIKSNFTVPEAQEYLHNNGLNADQVKSVISQARAKGLITNDRFISQVKVQKADNQQVELEVPKGKKKPIGDKIKLEVKKLLLDQYKGFAEKIELSGGVSIVEGTVRAEVADASASVKKTHGNDTVMFRSTVTITANKDHTLELGGNKIGLKAGGKYELVLNIPHPFSWANPEASPKQMVRHEWASLQARAETAYEVLKLDAEDVNAKMKAGEIPAHMTIGWTMEANGGATFKGDVKANAERKSRYTVTHKFVPEKRGASTAGRVDTTLQQRRADKGGLSGSFDIASYSPKLFGNMSALSQVTVTAKNTSDSELNDTLLMGKDKVPVLVKPWTFDDRDTDVARKYQFDSTLKGGARVVIPIEAIGGLSVSGGVNAGSRERTDITMQNVDAKNGERLAALWGKRDMEALFADEKLGAGRFQTVFSNDKSNKFGANFSQGWGNKYIGARAVASFARTSKENDHLKLAVNVKANERAHVVIERFSGEAFTRKLSAEIGVKIPSSLKKEITETLDEYMIGGDLMGMRDKVVDKLGESAFDLIKKYAEMAKVSMSYQRSTEHWGRETIEFDMNLGDASHRHALNVMANESKSWGERLEPALALGTFDMARLREGDKKKTDFGFNLAVLKYNLAKQTSRENEAIPVNVGNNQTMNIKAASGEFVKDRDGFATDTNFRFGIHHVSADGNRWNTMAAIQYHSEEANFWKSEANSVVGTGMALDADVDNLEMDKQTGFWGWFNRNLIPGEENLGEGTVDMVAVFSGNAPRRILEASPQEAYNTGFKVACDIAQVAGPVNRDQTAAAFGVSKDIVRVIGAQDNYIAENRLNFARENVWKKLSDNQKAQLVDDPAQVDKWLEKGSWFLGRNDEAKSFDRALEKAMPDALLQSAAQPAMLEYIRNNYDSHASTTNNKTLSSYMSSYEDFFKVKPQTHMWVLARAGVAQKLASDDLVWQSRIKLVAIEAREQLVREHATTLMREGGMADDAITELMAQLPFNARPDQPASWGPVKDKLNGMGFSEAQLNQAAARLDNPDKATRHALEASATQMLAEAGLSGEQIATLLAKVPGNASPKDPASWGILADLKAHGISDATVATASKLLTEVNGLLRGAYAQHVQGADQVPAMEDGNDAQPKNQLDAATIESLFDGILKVASEYSQSSSVFDGDDDADALALYATMAALAPDDVEAFFTVETDRMKYVASTDGFFDPKKKVNKDAEIKQLVAIAKANRK